MKYVLVTYKDLLIYFFVYVDCCCDVNNVYNFGIFACSGAKK